MKLSNFPEKVFFYPHVFLVVFLAICFLVVFYSWTKTFSWGLLIPLVIFGAFFFITWRNWNKRFNQAFEIELSEAKKFFEKEIGKKLMELWQKRKSGKITEEDYKRQIKEVIDEAVSEYHRKVIEILRRSLGI